MRSQSMQNSGPQPQEKVRSQEPGSLRATRLYFQSSREWPGLGNLRAGLEDKPEGVGLVRLHREGKQREPQCPRLGKGEGPERHREAGCDR